MIPFAELKSQYLAIRDEIDAALARVLDAGWFILGRECAAFEEEFAQYVGASHVVGCASGTDAIHLALRAASIGPGDDVITAANTCVPTVCGIVASGARVVLADVDPTTLTISPQALAEAITPRTRAVVAVHLYGHPCDMDAIMEVARSNSLIVVEDAAQAHGADYKNRKCGSIGDVAAFSFYPSKNLGAYGDGGAVVTNDAAISDRARQLRNYGEDRRYHSVCEGVNSRLDEMQAAVLRVKLRHLEAWNRARRDRADAYRAALIGAPLRLPSEADWARTNHHLFVVRATERDGLKDHLNSAGIGTQIHYPTPIHLQPAYRRLGYDAGRFPVSEQSCREVLSLPLYPELPMAAVDSIAAAIHDFYARRR